MVRVTPHKDQQDGLRPLAIRRTTLLRTISNLNAIDPIADLAKRSSHVVADEGKDVG